ncbi:class I adenylate-forming enzyme family protein [Solicola gregarius]|uniref:AMP-binding protein n=1 Tax=Solicola gregarius TaxID=2908642 RepID=A0AA46YLT2_9ACTN|nr:AMP-binding protein [Solicola gregarius]UYM07275.1 AMP-binding protein [Solicola gregarius]
MEHVEPGTVRAWARHLDIEPASVDPDALRSELTAGTIPGVLAAAACSRGAVAVDGERLTYPELRDRAVRAAGVLARAGVERGTRVVISAPSSMRFVVGYLAALHAGATVVLANPAYTSHELEALIARSQATLLLVDGSATTTAVGTLDLAELDDPGLDPHPGAALDSDDVALLAYTSGTTGTPKGVPLTHGALLASIRGAMRSWRWSADDTLVHALPLFHQHGLSGLHASLVAGSSLTVLARFDTHELISTAEHERATIVFAVPSIHQRLADLDAPELRPLRRLRLITSGSAPLSPAVADQLYAKAGLRPLERYGLTESGLDVSNEYGEPMTGTVGTPLPGVEVDLRTPDGDATDEGEIVLRGPQIFGGYLDDPDATAAAFWPGGWFRTGDVGRWDDGRLVITGRLKELIITGGMNVAPREVELVVEACAGVAEAVVAGVPSQRWGEEVAAWVVSEPGHEIAADSVIEHCRSRLAPYKCPKRVVVVESLPRNAMGKVVRSALVAP